MFVAPVSDMGTVSILQGPIMLWAVQDKADLRTGWVCVSGAPKPWRVLHSVWWRGAVVPRLRGSGPQVMATFWVFCHLLHNHTEVYVKEFGAGSSQIVDYHTHMANNGILRRKSRMLG